MRPGAILATNTFSIPLQQLRTGLQRPARLVGIHFFNPVSRLQLVEVVSHHDNDEQPMWRRRPFSAKSPPAAAGEELRRVSSSTGR